MPLWEDQASVSMAVQNLYLQLASYWSQGYCGYWSSGGWNGWLNGSEMREILDMNGEVQGEKDMCMGVFYLGHCDVDKMNKYKAKRQPIAEKVKWIF